MKDYNFFEEFIFKSNKIYLKYLIVPFTFIIVTGSIVGVYLYTAYEINKLSDKHDEYTTLINSQKYISTMNEIDALRTEIVYLENIQVDTEIFNVAIATDYIVTEEITKMILDSIPRNLVFSDYSITKDGVSINGFATDYSYIAEFENNLRNLNRFDNLLVSDITTNEDSLVSFSIELSIGGEIDD